MKLNSNNVFIACLVLIIMMLSCQADKLFYKNKNSNNNSSNNTKNNFSGSYCLSDQDINNPDASQIYKINRNSPCYRNNSSDYKYKYQFKKNEKENQYDTCKDPCPYLVNPHAEIPQSAKHDCGLDNATRNLDQTNGMQRDNLTIEDYKELLKKYERQIKIKTNTFERN
jgi:hypothetical protein